MGVLTVLALVLTITFIAYTHPDMLKSILPEWLTRPSQSSNTIGAELEDSEIDPSLHAEEGDATPKTKSKDPACEVPVFTLSGDDISEKEGDVIQEPEVPMFPAANSAQRASAMAPPSESTRTTSGLMLPPGRPFSNPSPRQGFTASPRLLSNGPLPNRGPPSGSQQRVSSSLSPKGVVSTPNTRGKVLLSPGHSPMDWAALTRGGNLGGVSTFQRVTPSQLKSMTGRKGKPAWSSWQGKVYNITPYLPFHPGGEAELMKAAGRDGTKLFMEIHPWVNWENMLGSCLVGVMIPENHGSGEGSLEDMD